jgi:dTMP kinase
MFIVFEGGEGSGKTSMAKLAVEHLQARGHASFFTHEPGGSAVGTIIRSLIVDEQTEPIGSTAELLLFLADRAHHVEQVIQPALAQGTTVICDRFTGSTLAYQIGARQLPDPELIIQMESYARQHLAPDLVIYLDVDPAIGIARKQADQTHTMNRLDNEKLQFHQAVRSYFQTLSQQRAYWVTVDASQSREQVQAAVLAHIDALHL